MKQARKPLLTAHPVLRHYSSHKNIIASIKRLCRFFHSASNFIIIPSHWHHRGTIETSSTRIHKSECLYRPVSTIIHVPRLPEAVLSRKRRQILQTIVLHGKIWKHTRNNAERLSQISMPSILPDNKTAAPSIYDRRVCPICKMSFQLPSLVVP